MIMKISEYLNKMRKESLEYDNVSPKDFKDFEQAVYRILNDPNASQNACLFDGEWYICITENESIECGAENLSLTLQDDGTMEEFAERVITGN